jgi:hypothetical protein
VWDARFESKSGRTSPFATSLNRENTGLGVDAKERFRHTCRTVHQGRPCCQGPVQLPQGHMCMPSTCS